MSKEDLTMKLLIVVIGLAGLLILLRIDGWGR
jgi:hypothetical protein